MLNLKQRNCNFKTIDHIDDLKFENLAKTFGIILSVIYKQKMSLLFGRQYISNLQKRCQSNVSQSVYKICELSAPMTFYFINQSQKFPSLLLLEDFCS